MDKVTVAVLREFVHQDHLFYPGDPIELVPIDAAVFAQRGDVSLNARPTYRTRDMTAQPVVEVVHVAPPPVFTGLPQKRKRGRPRKSA